MNDNFIELSVNTCDASKEKHIPEVSFSNNLMNICVGSDLHPMSKEHFIDWVYIEYPNGIEEIGIRSFYLNTKLENIFIRNEKSNFLLWRLNTQKLSWNVDFAIWC